MSAPIELTRELKRLGLRYGPAVVREEANRALKAKRGPKIRPDLKFILPVIEQDGRDLLEGRDYKKRRSNHSVAMEIARSIFKSEGSVEDANFQRLKKKLGRDRLKNAARFAFFVSEIEYPFKSHFDIYVKYKSLNPDLIEIFEYHVILLERFYIFFGDPAEKMTMREIREALDKWAPQERGNFLAKLMRQAELLGT